MQRSLDDSPLWQTAPFGARSGGVRRAALVSLLLAVAGCDNEDPPTAKSDASVLLGDAGDEQEPDAELDAGELDASQPDRDATEDDAEPDTEVDAEPDASAPTTDGLPCTVDQDCADGVYCNGAERCLKEGERQICRPALVPPCSQEHRCLEADSTANEIASCECDVPDRDGDRENAIECGGDDCDDSRRTCNTKRTEVCDGLGLDEDCRPKTIHGANSDGDSDGDGFIDQGCFNVDRETLERFHGDDCDDHNPYVAPHNPEVCNYRDDNCNGHIDEVLEADGKTFTDGALRAKYLPDLDRDGHADKFAEPQLACDYLQPPGQVPITKASADDCNDTPVEGATIYPTAVEECDSIDNDCDGLVDAADAKLRRKYSFPDTDVKCISGKWQITDCPQGRLFCANDAIERGCGTDGTRLSSCGSCDRRCQFACGDETCDEIVQVAAGLNHTCGRTSAGRVACWGQGADGRLGNGNTAQSSRPVWALNLTGATTVAAGYAFSCAIAGTERALRCWGRNDEGQLGVNDSNAFVDTPSPAVMVTGARLENVARVSAGTNHACVVLTNGRLLCFGSSAGLLGNGINDVGSSAALNVRRLVSRPPPLGSSPSDVSDAQDVAAGRRHTCALLLSGSVGCWGDNDFGQLGDGTSAASLYLKLVPGLANVSKLAAGTNHTCAVSQGALYCWGYNLHSQLGHPSGAADSTPTKVDGVENVTDVVAGDDHTCVRVGDGRVFCWGSNANGQLGVTDATESATPVLVPLQGVEALATNGGSEHVCALVSGSRVICWGNNAYGELGNSAQNSNRDFTPITSVTGAVP